MKTFLLILSVFATLLGLAIRACGMPDANNVVRTGSASALPLDQGIAWALFAASAVLVVAVALWPASDGQEAAAREDGH